MEKKLASSSSADKADSMQTAFRLLLWGLAVAFAIALVGSLLFLSDRYRDFPYSAF